MYLELNFIYRLLLCEYLYIQESLHNLLDILIFLVPSTFTKPISLHTLDYYTHAIKISINNSGTFYLHKPHLFTSFRLLSKSFHKLYSCLLLLPLSLLVSSISKGFYFWDSLKLVTGQGLIAKEFIYFAPSTPFSLFSLFCLFYEALSGTYNLVFFLSYIYIYIYNLFINILPFCI